MSAAESLSDTLLELMMLHGVAGRVFVVLFPPLNVSVFAVSGDLLVCLSYLAGLGVAVSHCLPHWASLCPEKGCSCRKETTVTGVVFVLRLCEF